MTIAIIEGYDSIGDNAFQNTLYLTSITIGDSVTSIGKNLFNAYANNNPALKELTIGNGVTNIGDSAFTFATNLTSVTFAEGSQLTSIGPAVFSYNYALTSINIPSTITTIGQSAFYACYALESIDIQDTVEYIGDYAFYECIKLKNINRYNIMPTSIKTIGGRVFKNTLIASIMFMMDNYNNLTSTSFNDNAFSDSNITSFTMSEGIANRLGVSFNYNNDDEYGAFGISFYGKSNVNIYSSVQPIVQPVIMVPGVHFLL